VVSGTGWRGGYKIQIVAHPEDEQEVKERQQREKEEEERAQEEEAGELFSPGMSLGQIVVSAPEPAGKGDPDDATASSLSTYLRTWAIPGCAPLNLCEIWEERIRGFFYYNGRYAWWRAGRSPVCTHHAASQFSVNEVFCDWIGPNHQKYGDGYHITAQTRFYAGVNAVVTNFEGYHAITVRMFGSGGVYGHATDKVCNPSRPGC